MTKRLKKATSLLAFTLLSFALSLCTSDDPKVKEFDKAAFSFSTVEVNKSYQNCEMSQNNCTHISFSYPVFTALDSEVTLKKIQRKLESLMLVDFNTKTPKGAASEFIDMYDAFVSDPENKPFNEGWYDIRTVRWLSLEKKVMSLSCTAENYYGGAHPNRSVTLYNFYPNTGDSLSLKTIFSPQSLDELTQIAEKVFRQERQLSADESLSEAGFWFDRNRFELTDNFAFTDEGLWFYYNAYEVASYAMGPTSIVVPYPMMNHLFEHEL